MCTDLDEICKVQCERDALKSFNEKIKSAWYDLILDEAISTTIYALAYDKEKDVKMKRLMKARRELSRNCKKYDPEFVARAKADTDQNIILKKGKSEILDFSPTYDTDQDIEANPGEDEKAAKLNTKNVRGKNVANKEKDKNRKKASSIYKASRTADGGRGNSQAQNGADSADDEEEEEEEEGEEEEDDTVDVRLFYLYYF